jgi:hypothetical protein
MDCTKVRAADPTGVPSMVMACEGVASSRDMVTLTLEDGGLPGQSTFRANRVEITNDPEFFWLLSPGAEVPWKYETRPRSREALPAPWLRSNAPVGAGRIVMVGAAGATTTGVMVLGAPVVCPNAARLKSSANIPTRNRTACLEFIKNQNWLGLIGPSQYRSSKMSVRISHRPH